MDKYLANVNLERRQINELNCAQMIRYLPGNTDNRTTVGTKKGSFTN